MEGTSSSQHYHQQTTSRERKREAKEVKGTRMELKVVTSLSSTNSENEYLQGSMVYKRIIVAARAPKLQQILGCQGRRITDTTSAPRIPNYHTSAGIMNVEFWTSIRGMRKRKKNEKELGFIC